MDLQFPEQEKLIRIARVVVLEVNAEAPILEDAVVEASTAPVVPTHRRQFAVADGGEVRDLRIRVGQETQRHILEFEVIALEVETVLAHHVRLVHEGEKELHVPVPSHVILEVFFGREGHSNVLEVDRTTHDLQAIVEGGDNFHVLNGRA